MLLFGNRLQKIFRVFKLTCNDVEHSGVEDGWTDESQEDEATEQKNDRLQHAAQIKAVMSTLDCTYNFFFYLMSKILTLQLLSSSWCWWAIFAAQTFAGSRR